MQAVARSVSVRSFKYAETIRSFSSFFVVAATCLQTCANWYICVRYVIYILCRCADRASCSEDNYVEEATEVPADDLAIIHRFYCDHCHHNGCNDGAQSKK